MLDSLLWLAGVALGCGGAPMAPQIPVHRSRAYQRPIDTLGVESSIRAPADRVWAVLPAVLTGLGLDLNFREPAAMRVGACYQRVRVRLGRDILSSLVDCGEINSLPNADRYEIELTVLTSVRPKTDREASIFTFVLGVGRDMSVSGGRLWCYSKGGLEERIRAGIERQLADAP
jgi:hypothetical protein